MRAGAVGVELAGEIRLSTRTSWLHLGCKTKRAAVEEALRLMVRLRRQADIRKLRGKLRWRGSLDAMRRDG